MNRLLLTLAQEIATEMPIHARRVHALSEESTAKLNHFAHVGKNRMGAPFA